MRLTCGWQECFNSPYGTEHFPKYAEPIPTSASTVDETASPSYTAMSALAASLKIHLIAGSIPERETGSNKLYNTSMIFNPSGTLVATHRKTHLFDIDIPGKIRFIESEVLSAGRNAPTLIDLPGFGRVAVAICYDVRFPELAMIAARKGAFALVYPGAFNMTTGPLHWELLARARAVDNQVYVAMCSPARDMDAGYNAWGSSMVVDPNAEVVVKAGSEEETVECVLDPERIRSTRAGIPVTTQRRFDVYADVSKVSPTDPPGKDGEAKGEGVEEPEDFDIRWIRSKCQPYLRK